MVFVAIWMGLLVFIGVSLSYLVFFGVVPFLPAALALIISGIVLGTLFAPLAYAAETKRS